MTDLGTLPTVVDTTTELIAKLRDPRRRDQVLRLGRLVDADLQQLDLRDVVERVRSSSYRSTVGDDAVPWQPRG